MEKRKREEWRKGKERNGEKENQIGWREKREKNYYVHNNSRLSLEKVYLFLCLAEIFELILIDVKSTFLLFQTRKIQAQPLRPSQQKDNLNQKKENKKTKTKNPLVFINFPHRLSIRSTQYTTHDEIKSFSFEKKKFEMDF